MIEVLGEVRHRCLACSQSCHGVRVPLVGESDLDGIRAAEEALGISAPIVDGEMLAPDGVCVFLNSDGLCGIHAELGPSAKPLICRQWPVIAVRVGPAVRVGIDPACYTHYRTYATAPKLEASGLRVATIEVSDREAQVEDQLVHLLSVEGMTVARALGALAGSGDVLPVGLDSRWIAAIQDASFDTILAEVSLGTALSMHLRALFEAAATLDRADPPPWPAWDRQVDAYAVDAVRRLVWLRLTPQGPGAVPVAAMGLCGALLAGWCAPEDPDLSTRWLASWFRLLRSPAAWRVLVPDPLALQRLLRG